VIVYIDFNRDNHDNNNHRNSTQCGHKPWCVSHYTSDIPAGDTGSCFFRRTRITQSFKQPHERKHTASSGGFHVDYSNKNHSIMVLEGMKK
jgi:hypothetical protein